MVNYRFSFQVAGGSDIYSDILIANYGFVRNFFVFRVLSFFSPISIVVNGIWSTLFIRVANDDTVGIVGSIASVIVRIFSPNLDF